MGIRPFSVMPTNLAEWGRYLRDTVVTPSVDSVTNSTLRDSDGCSVIGRSASTSGDPADIVAESDGHFLARHSGVLGFAAIADTDIPSTIARDTEVTAAIAAHAGEANPHPGYLTEAEGDALYRPLDEDVPYADLSGVPAALGMLYSGTGDPEGAVVAPVGSLFLRTDGGANTTFYVKESGAGDEGWAAK